MYLLNEKVTGIYPQEREEERKKERRKEQREREERGEGGREEQGKREWYIFFTFLSLRAEVKALLILLVNLKFESTNNFTVPLVELCNNSKWTVDRSMCSMWV